MKYIYSLKHTIVALYIYLQLSSCPQSNLTLKRAETNPDSGRGYKVTNFILQLRL